MAGSYLAQNHVGTNRNVNVGVCKTQSRPCTLDLRGAGPPSPSDRRTGNQFLCLPVSLGRSTRRYTRLVPTAEAADLGDSGASSSFDPISTASSSTDGESPTAEKPKGPSSLPKRALFGTILGISGAVVILLGGWVYAAATCLVAFQCSKEFMGLVNAKGISEGMKPPPRIISYAISLLCVALNAWAFTSGGRTASAMAVATFIVLSLQLLASTKPRFAQLTSAVFGLVYCGYLPSFWIKLRWLAMPALHSTVMQHWQSVVGGVSQATVGVVACFVTVACIIAADTGAYFCGKSLGRTKLISISPKKTVEGAIGGLLSSIGVALALFKLFAWPDTAINAAALGTVIFISSLFGDLIESVIKRDAGLKDASNLIPGHGGLLDRMDSYLFTGACVYFFIRYCIRGYGVL